ncbi:MAG: MerR family transcriptional regulator [Candidatus Delongbacteria bacterium]|jgi:DNA-binding transcriptional MerR regulator|nr:MerR family transcriptional regulator [Candidatus Delongbacteria bacterium]
MTNKNDKLYYSIGEVADRFCVNASLIRYWEKEFPVIRPHKNSRGQRMFTQKDIEHFHKIYHLVKERGMTLNGAKNLLRNQPETTENKFQVVNTLKNIRNKLEALKSNMD